MDEDRYPFCIVCIVKRVARSLEETSIDLD
jgi:hypothetical protein